MRKIFIENWRLAFVPNQQAVKDGVAFKTPQEVENSGLQVIQATVPGNYEMDFMRENTLLLYFKSFRVVSLITIFEKISSKTL